MSESDALFTYVDRYGNGPSPDPETMCQGQCEGTGYYPQRIDDPDMLPVERERVDVVLSEGKQDCSDGYAFIRCPDCEGTGKREPPV